MATAEQIKGALKAVIAVADAIKDMGADGAPLGPMYMALAGKGMSHDGFMQMIDLLVQSGRVRVSNHCAYWVEL